MPFQTFDFERADVRARLAALSLEVKLLRFAHALRGGRWDRKDSDHDTEGPGDDDGPGRVWGSVQYAQNFPKDHNGPPEPVDDGEPPLDDLPKEKPTEVGAVSFYLRFVALLPPWTDFAKIAIAAPWVISYAPDIAAYNDPPKTFDQLTDGVGSSKSGYQDHHIREQTSAARDGFPRAMINAKDNIVKISTLKHREITTWYGQRNPNFGGLTPREYLSGRSWEERYAVGIQQLIEKGILKP